MLLIVAATAIQLTGCKGETTTPAGPAGPGSVVLTSEATWVSIYGRPALRLEIFRSNIQNAKLQLRIKIPGQDNRKRRTFPWFALNSQFPPHHVTNRATNRKPESSATEFTAHGRIGLGEFLE